MNDVMQQIRDQQGQLAVAIARELFQRDDLATGYLQRELQKRDDTIIGRLGALETRIRDDFGKAVHLSVTGYCDWVAEQVAGAYRMGLSALGEPVLRTMGMRANLPECTDHDRTLLRQQFELDAIVHNAVIDRLQQRGTELPGIGRVEYAVEVDLDTIGSSTAHSTPVAPIDQGIMVTENKEKASAMFIALEERLHRDLPEAWTTPHAAAQLDAIAEDLADIINANDLEVGECTSDVAALILGALIRKHGLQPQRDLSI